MSGVAGDVCSLRRGERLADRDCRSSGPGAELAREVAVEPLAVLEEVGVAVLVAGAGDEHGPLLGEGLGPVERQRDAGQGVVVDEVVARWQPAPMTMLFTRLTDEAASSVVIIWVW